MKPTLFLVLLALTACVGGRKIPYLYPTNAYTTTATGKKFVVQTIDSLTIYAGYAYATDAALVFNIELRNKKMSPVSIDPSAWVAQGLLSEAKGNKPALYAMGVPAFNPRVILAGMINEITSQKSGFRKIPPYSPYLAPKGHLTLAPYAKNASTESEDLALNLDGGVNYKYRNHASYDFIPKLSPEEMEQLKARREESLLKESTLAPGHTVQGLLFFPRQDKFDQLRLVFPIGEMSFTFDFDQHVSRAVPLNISVK